MAASNGSASSSTTSTSHTLSALHAPSPTPSGATNQLAQSTMASNPLLALLDSSARYQFLQPSKLYLKSTVAQTKALLDSYAIQIADEQAQRLKNDRKRKRSGDERFQSEGLKVRKVHTEGFGAEQVWEQARRVADALGSEVARDVEDFGFSEEDEESEKLTSNGVLKSVTFGKDGFEVESDDESLEDAADFDDENEDEEDGEELDNGGEGAESDDDLEDDDGGDIDDLLHGLEGEDDYEEEDDEEDEEEAGVFVPDSHGLNDGFFSIDDFNKQTEFLEQQDAAADPYTGEASDEEDIDWDANPMTVAPAPTSSSSRAKAMDVEESDDDEDGPTFGNADLNAPEGDSDVADDDGAELDDDVGGAGDNTNEVLYKDFFAPPPRKAGKGERQASYLERQERKSKTQPEEDEEATMERAISDVRRDLFDDESDNEGSEDALSDVDAGDPKSRKSAHERRQAKLGDEIRRLEAASVAKREWTLSGEARAADRPLNSLLEEDLDFERTGKPVPVITAEVSESIEELIKRRILAQEFDEVIRRRPDSESVPSTTRRGQFELDDSKPQQSLAEMYEEEHVKNIDPDAYMSKADEKIRKQHQEIEGLWKEVSAKLDSLSSWHYKPKPAAPSLTVVADVATVSMEDAQPTTASGMAGADSMLAPQEIYKAGKDKAAVEKGEVVPKSGAPVARQEMTREDKVRRRRREKERIKKRGGEEVDNIPQSKKAREKKQTVDELKKGGVKIIGKRGDIRDVDGNKIKAAIQTSGAGGFKL